MSPSPKRGSSRFAPRSAQSMSPPSRSAGSPTSRSGIPAPSARPSLSALTTGSIGRTSPAGPRSISGSNTSSSSGSGSGSSGSAPQSTAGGHAFRTISAGTFRNNNPFAQRLQLAFAPASLSTGRTSRDGSPGRGGTEIGNISSSPIYDRQRTQPDIDIDMSEDSPHAKHTPHTPPLQIIKSATPKSKARVQVGGGGKVGSTGTGLDVVSGIPQYTSRFGSPSLFTPPPTAHAGDKEKNEARLVSPTLDIPEPRLSQHQQNSKGDERLRAGFDSPSPAATARGGGYNGESRIPTSLPGQAARRSRFINQPRSSEGTDNSLHVSGLPNSSANGGNKQRKPGVQRKTVPTLSPDTAHAASLPHTRSPVQSGASPNVDAPRKSSPSTLSPPSFTQTRNGRSMRQPSVPVLRGGGQSVAAVQGRRRATSTSATTKSASSDTSASTRAEGGRLAPALPIVGRKDKTVHVLPAPSSPPPTRGETGDTTRTYVANSMTRSRSKSLIGIVNDSPDARLRRAADAASARLQNKQDDRVGNDLGVPEHIRFRLRTLHQLSRVLGFEQSDIAQEIDIPGLLGRVDRAQEKYKDVVSHVNERVETRTPEMDDAFAKTGPPHYMAETPGVHMMAEALKQDWSAELKKNGEKGVGEETILGSPLELLPSDAPFDVWPKTSAKHGSQATESAPASLSSSASQRSILDLDMISGGGRFGASPSLSFATFGLGLSMADWTHGNMVEQDIMDGPLLRLDQVKQDPDKTGKKDFKKRNWRSGMISRFKSIGRKDGDQKDGHNGGDDSDDEDFLEGQTDRRRKAATIGVWDVPAFGLALTDLPLDAWKAVQLDGDTHHVPLAASLCVNELWDRGMSSPGLFRLAGGEDQVERTFSTLNTPPFYGLGADLSSCSPYSIAHVLKRFLRDLPEPLLDESLLAPLWTWCCAPDFLDGGLASMSMHPAHTRRISAATLLLRLLPAQHLSLLTYIMAFISHLQCASENRLTLDAIAVVFGPAMLAPRGEGVPGVGAGTKGEKSDAVRVAMLVDQSQKCLAWLLRYWPLIRPDLGKAVVPLPVGKPIRPAQEETENRPASPGSPRHGVDHANLHTASRPKDPHETRGNQSLDIPRPTLGSVGRKSGLSSSVSLSSFGLSSSPSLGEMNKKTRASSPLASPEVMSLGGKLKASGSTASGLGGNLRSALSSMNLSAAYKGEEGVKVPKKSASFNNLSAVFKKGMGLGKQDRKNKTLSSTPSTPNDSPLLLTPAESPDLGVAALPRSSLSCDGRPSSLFSTTSIANSQVSSVLGSLQDLLSSKDRQIERDARELAVLRYTLLEMNSKLSALSHSMPSSPNKTKPSCGCATEHKEGDTHDKVEAQASPIITITQSPSIQLNEDTDELISDLRSQLDNALAALAVSRETTLTKDKQLVSIHQTLARHRAERLSETNKLESQLLIEVAKNKGLREERDLAKVRLEKVKHELFKVM